MRVQLRKTTVARMVALSATGLLLVALGVAFLVRGGSPDTTSQTGMPGTKPLQAPVTADLPPLAPASSAPMSTTSTATAAPPGINGGSGASPAARPGEPEDIAACTANDVTAGLTDAVGATDDRYAAIQFTARTRCRLPGRIPVELVGADDVLMNNTAAPDAPGLTLESGSSAYLRLHWTVYEALEDQQTPNAIVVSIGGEQVNIPWHSDDVDASDENHDIDVDPLRPGTF